MNFPPYSAAIFNTLSYLRLIFISAFVPLSILSLPPPLLPLNRVHLSCAAQWIWISSSCKFFFPTIAYMCTLRLCVYMTHWLDANNMFAYPKVPFFSRRSLLIHDAPWFMHFMLLPVLLFGQPVLAAVYYIVLLKIRKCKCRPSQWDAKERKEGRNKKKIHHRWWLGGGRGFFIYFYTFSPVPRNKNTPWGWNGMRAWILMYSNTFLERPLFAGRKSVSI